MPNDPSAIRNTAALHGIDSFQPSSSSPLSQQPHEARQHRSIQSLDSRGRSSSAPPALHQRGRTRTREANPTTHPGVAQSPGDTDASSGPAAPASEQSRINDMESRQQRLMDNQYKLHVTMEERQTAMLCIKTSADMTKLMSDTVTEITNGFMDSARKVMKEGGEAMKLH